MRKLIYTSVAMLGLFLLTSGTSEAGRIRFSLGGGHHHHGHHGLHRGPVYNGWYGGGYGGAYRSPRWHDTSHWDYHPGGFQRHGNHYHYVPGHYDWHQTGHWHH